VRAHAALTALLLGAARPAGAEPLAGESAGALPGIRRVGVPEPLRAAAAVAAGAGYGYTESVLSDDDVHHRATGSLAVGLRALDWLAVAARLDGRYDAHSGTPGGSDDGWIGDPSLAARAFAGGERLRLGLEAVVRAPGADAPSVVPAALSGDLVLQGAWAPRRFVLAANAGFRLDRSASSAPRADELSEADRLALGVSDSSAVLAGIGAGWRAAPRLLVLGEATWDILVGEDAPAALESPLRLGAGVRFSATRRMDLFAMLDSNLGRRPALGAGEALAPVEPRVSALVGVTWRAPQDDPGYIEPPPPARERTRRVAAPPPTATLRGRVRAPNGEGIPGVTARILAAGAGSPVEVVTGADGRFEATGLPPGRATVTLSGPGFEELVQEVDLEAGRAGAIEPRLERDLPEGQVRGVVSSFDGAPLQATVTVEPGGASATTDADGAFQLDVPPGSYSVVVSAPGWREQRRRVQVVRNGVVVINVDLRASRGP
jgi:hypothetical protein